MERFSIFVEMGVHGDMKNEMRVLTFILKKKLLQSRKKNVCMNMVWFNI
jgi:hypothetical protein